MAKKEIKDVIGVIKRITEAKSREFTGKNGAFTIWSIGILLDDGNWYNLKDGEQQKVQNQLYSDKLNRAWKRDDEVKMYLEAEDVAGKYWKITTILPFNPTAEVSEEVVKQTSIPASAQIAPSVPTKETTMATPIPAPALPSTPEEPASTPEKVQPKNMEAVTDYKVKEADKYELGMAKNIAAELIKKVNTKDTEELYQKYEALVRKVYTINRKIRQDILGY